MLNRAAHMVDPLRRLHSVHTRHQLFGGRSPGPPWPHTTLHLSERKNGSARSKATTSLQSAL